MVTADEMRREIVFGSIAARRPIGLAHAVRGHVCGRPKFVVERVCILACREARSSASQLLQNV